MREPDPFLATDGLIDGYRFRPRYQFHGGPHEENVDDIRLGASTFNVKSRTPTIKDCDVTMPMVEDSPVLEIPEAGT